MFMPTFDVGSLSTKDKGLMPFLSAKLLSFQGSTDLPHVGSFSDLVKRYKTWEKKIKTDIFEETLPADTVIKELIEKAGIIECDDYVTLAYNRYRIGNPPGKDNKYGDAINWECLLSCVPDGEDLYFISADKDYKSIMSDDYFNPFLKEEWLTKKGSEIVFYKNLG